MSPEERAKRIKQLQGNKPLGSGNQAPLVEYYASTLTRFLDSASALAVNLSAEHHTRMREVMHDVQSKADTIIATLDDQP